MDRPTLLFRVRGGRGDSTELLAMDRKGYRHAYAERNCWLLHETRRASTLLSTAKQQG